MGKGIAYSTVVIVALLGVLMLSVWSYSQLSTGSYVGTYTERTDEDIANSKLELAKKFLSQDLIYSSQEAALEVASNGGTLQSKTFWYCNSDPQPVTKQEFLHSLSTLTLDYLNAYIEGLKDSDIAKLGISASKYSCAGIYSPEDTACSQKNSAKCEYFRSTATGEGMVKVTDPITVSYSGDLSASNDNNRIMWIRQRLEDDTKDSKMFRVITSALRDQCRGPQTMAQKLEVSFQKACEHLVSILDKDVKCTYSVSCVDTSNPIACLNFDCKRPETTQETCFKSAQSSPHPGLGDLLKDIGGKAVKAQQGISSSGVVIKFSLTDKKYNIATSKEMKPLVFNMWAAFDISPQECRPID
ncbi:hypothetical protein HZB88_03225 [archaeon]|nr:hypothetical protein [archaeon]